MNAAQGMTVELDDEAGTRRLAEDVAMVLKAGDVIALVGDLGAGKTTLARFILRALADDPCLEVPSPTFTLAQVYQFERLSVTHFDLYRLSDADEIDEIGFDEAFATGAALIEWPDRAGDRLPADTLVLSIDTPDEPETPDARRIALAAPNADWHARLARSFAERRFLDGNGWRDAERRYLQGDASTRSYERIKFGDRRAVLMNAPARPDGPPVADGLPYSRIAHLAEDVRPFVAVGGALFRAGFSAPELIAHDLDAGLLLLEDLGGEGVVDDGAPIVDRYRVAVELLADLHGRDWPSAVGLPDGGSHRLPAYDRRALEIEIGLLPAWYVAQAGGGALSEAAETAFFEAWRPCFEQLEQAETSWTLRDFHSPNLLWLPDRDGIRRIGLLDFQDAVIGPAAYDLASLLQDARVTVAADLERELFDHYCRLRRAGARPFEPERFDAAYAIMAAQRATKVLGIFARLDRRDGKPGYLRHIPRLTSYLRRTLDHPVLSDVRVWYGDNVPLDV